VPREYSWLDSEVRYGVLSYYYGSGWYDTPADRLPVYETKMNLSETTAFYLDEMDSLGWHLQDTFLQGGWPVLYLFFERDGAILPIILESGTPGITHIAAILPPPEDVLEAVLSGWENYTTQNSDLHDDAITAIAIDTSGKAWVGTNNGLIAFDGETWTPYTAEEMDLSIEGPDYSVSAMTVDQDGRLWVGTQEDLSVYDGQTWKTYTPGDSDWAFLPKAMTVDSNGRVWFALGYSESVSVFDGNTFTNYGPGEVGMPVGHAIDGIATDQQDRIWIGTSGGGVHVFDGYSWDTARRAKSPQNETNLTYVINDLAVDQQGSVWIGTGEGLFVFDGETWTTYNTENSGLVDDSIGSLGIDHSNRVWTATTGGRLNLLDTSGEWTDYTPVNSDISLYFPDALTIDPQGRIWIGSNWDGVSVFTPPQSQ
jgi:ligand-binding sensor domain-containing protein